MKDNIYYLAQRKEHYNKYREAEKRGNKNYLLLLLIILIFILSYLYLINYQVLLYTAHYGEVVDGFQSRGLVLRNETVYSSNISGIIELRSAEGDRVSSGTEILKINEHLIYNNHPGIISYANDGLEEILNPYNISNINLEKYNSIKRNFKQNTNGDYIQKGQAAYRIVNNNELYIIIQCSQKEINRYLTNERVFIQSDINGNLIRARVYDKYINGDKGLMTLKLDNFIEEWINLRWVEFKFIKNIYKGIKVPRGSVFRSSEGQGVLVYRNGNYSFRNINIINGNTEEVIVKGIHIGEQIVVNPEELNYGRGG
ncbi:MAG: HlyD family efflux transporter periplasmic adaptor subunit [bacterium]